MKNIDVLSLKVIKEKNLKVENKKITSPNDVFEILKDFIGDSDREHFIVMCLSTKNNVNAINVISTGTLNSSLVHPREVFKIAILKNSASIIIAHNHPSGDVTESKEDLQITHRLKDAGKILGIEILDHIIVSDQNYKSLKEEGLI